jgi:hypothetical protein
VIVFACDADKYSTSIKKVFRSYRDEDSKACPFTIAEVGRAVTADPKYFKTVHLGEDHIADGANGFANPSDELLKECKKIFPHSRINFLNLGTGENKNYGLRDMFKSLRAVPEKVEDAFRHVAYRLEWHGNAWRLKTPTEGPKVWPDEVHKIRIVERRTVEYLEHREVRNQIWDCSEAMALALKQ